MKDAKLQSQDDSDVILASLTCERLSSFARSLETFAPAYIDTLDRSHSRFSACSKLLVCDDSMNPDTVTAKKHLVSIKAREWNCRALYWGQEEKQACSLAIKKILKSFGFPADHYGESVEFLLFGSRDVQGFQAPGANQNSQLVLSARSKLVSFDDDVFILPRIIRNEYTKQVASEAGVSAGAFHSEDMFFSISEEWTGNPWYELTEKLGTSAVFVDSEKKEQELCIRSINTGFYGGRWFDVPFSILTIQHPFRQSIEEGKSQYRSLLCAPYVFTQSNDFLVRNPVNLAGAIGIDTTSIVPPFLPHVRMQEHIWQTMLASCHPGSCTASVPFMLYHDAEAKGSFTPADYQNVSSTLGRHVLTTINGLMETYKTETRGSTVDYAYFGQSFLDLSELSYRDWLRFCRHIWAQSVIPGIRSFQQLLDEHNRKPRYWVKDMEKFISHLKSGMNDAADFVPRELQTSGSANIAHETWQHLFRQWGLLLLHWPAIWSGIEQWHESEKPWERVFH